MAPKWGQQILKETKVMNKRNRTVPAIVSGKKIGVNPDSIHDWNKHSGKTRAGATVASLKSAEVGDSILIRNGSAVLSATKDELEVFATQFLESNGFQVTATA